MKFSPSSSSTLYKSNLKTIFRSTPTSPQPPITTRFLSTHTKLSSWSTIDPESNQLKVQNYVQGKWVNTKSYTSFPDPLTGKESTILVPDTQHDLQEEIQPFYQQLQQCPKSGLHNPLKNPQRYVELGQAMFKCGEALDTPEINHFFTRLIQRCVPKSWAQCNGELKITSAFIKTFAGDATRFFIGRGFSVSGDHPGQESRGYRWPYGPVAMISPFNFPLEIPALQTLGAILAGNCVLVKPAEKVAPVMEQFLRLMLACGVPSDTVMLLNGRGSVVESMITAKNTPIRLTQFTGSSRIAERLAEKTHGKVRIEDAGFNWKVLGPISNHPTSFTKTMMEYIAFVCDQDAYAASGQKCSAQSCLFLHQDWIKAGFIKRLEQLANRRKLSDLTIGPVLTWTTDAMLSHVNKMIKQTPNASLAFGGSKLTDPGAEKIPSLYGAIKPTAVKMHIKDLMSTQEIFELCTTEVFGPVQILVEYDDSTIDLVIQATERMSHHLTCAVVSPDPDFQHKFLSNTVNGTTYCGLRARTTGAPTNHWFGPSNDPRGAGIGTPESIAHVWTSHREIIKDELKIGDGWGLPAAS
jgi:1-pyrroline-5-carboxylate dehydrogenase